MRPPTKEKTMNAKLASAKNFVVRHKTAIAVTTTVVVMFAINRAALKQHDDFLKENDLYDKFYTLEDEI
jgi:hypothetical protein